VVQPVLARGALGWVSGSWLGAAALVRSARVREGQVAWALGMCGGILGAIPGALMAGSGLLCSAPGHGVQGRRAGS
jgi:hypothetical protein